jgi:hypothetical protein
MEKSKLWSRYAGLFILLLIGARLARTYYKNRREEAKPVIAYVEPGAVIEGLDDNTIKVGETKPFQLALKGLSCNDLRISASRLSLQKTNADACGWQISSETPGNGFIKVMGAGKVLIDSFPITVVK